MAYAIAADLVHDDDYDDDDDDDVRVCTQNAICERCVQNLLTHRLVQHMFGGDQITLTSCSAVVSTRLHLVLLLAPG